jgi:hypothetical protein
MIDPERDTGRAARARRPAAARARQDQERWRGGLCARHNRPRLAEAIQLGAFCAPACRADEESETMTAALALESAVLVTCRQHKCVALGPAPPPIGLSVGGRSQIGTPSARGWGRNRLSRPQRSSRAIIHSGRGRAERDRRRESSPRQQSTRIVIPISARRRADFESRPRRAELAAGRAGRCSQAAAAGPELSMCLIGAGERTKGARQTIAGRRKSSSSNRSRLIDFRRAHERPARGG